MVHFALRTLLYDRVRFLIAVGGVAFAILLMLVLRGIMDGTVAKSTAYVDHVGADVFVAQQGVQHFALTSSVVPVAAEPAARAVPGVRAAVGIVSVPLVARIGGHEAAVRLVGFDPAGGLGGPWAMASGTASIDAGGVIVDRTLASSEGLDVGDTLTLAGQQFTVQGLSRGTNALAGKVVFVTRDVAARMVGTEGAYSYLLVQADHGVSADEVAARLRTALPDTSVMTRAEFSRNERDLLTGLFVTPVNVMAVIGMLVGIMVVGLTIYTVASERLRDFGVLKAIGASNRYVYLVILRLGLLVGMIGFVVGLGAGYLVKPLVEYFVPDLGIAYRPEFILAVLGIAAGMSLLSALLPVYRIAGVDPKEVFKA
ncbi:MAG: FtsX-like permease family protein [Dehalococcoidia bacterium]